MKGIIFNEGMRRKLLQRKYNVPVIGHFADKSVIFNSILQVYELTGLPYHQIFENCIGKIKCVHTPGSGTVSIWEFENGADYIKYKAAYIKQQRSYMSLTGFNGQILHTPKT